MQRGEPLERLSACESDRGRETCGTSAVVPEAHVQGFKGSIYNSRRWHLGELCPPLGRPSSNSSKGRRRILAPQRGIKFHHPTCMAADGKSRKSLIVDRNKLQFLSSSSLFRYARPVRTDQIHISLHQNAETLVFSSHGLPLFTCYAAFDMAIIFAGLGWLYDEDNQ